MRQLEPPAKKTPHTWQSTRLAPAIPRKGTGMAVGRRHVKHGARFPAVIDRCSALYDLDTGGFWDARRKNTARAMLFSHG